VSRIDCFRSKLHLADNPRTETKATTVWPAKDLIALLPKILHSSVRASKYYTAGNDSWTIQAQNHRSRGANLDENHQKMAEEVERIFKATVPGQTSDATKKKHQEQ
jgi:peptidyl-tRNA hydrolase ICT1